MPSTRQQIVQRKGRGVKTTCRPNGRTTATSQCWIGSDIEGRGFCGNAGRLAGQMRALVADAKPRGVTFDLSRVPDLEYTALKMLTKAEKRQRG